MVNIHQILDRLDHWMNYKMDGKILDEKYTYQLYIKNNVIVINHIGSQKYVGKVFINEKNEIEIYMHEWDTHVNDPRNIFELLIDKLT